MMSFKKLIGLTTGLVMALVVAAPAQAQQHRATRLGNPATRFAKPLKKADDLRVLLRAEKMKADVAAILQQVGWKGNLEDLDRGAATADIEDIEIPTGTRLPYMAARKRGEPVALMDVEWAGKKPFEAFAFEFSSNCQRYRLVTPKKCSNFWIEDLGKDTSEACMPKPDPVVGITAGEKQVCVTQPVQFTVDVENYAADGPVALSVNGKEAAKGNLSAGTFKWTFPGARTPGTYEIKAVAGDFSTATKVEVVACEPTCGLTASPQPVKAGKPFTLDVSGSQVAPGVTGGIASVQVEVLREGEVVDTVNMAAPNFVNNNFIIAKGGPHTVRAVVTDEAGQVSTNVCQADLDVKGGLPFFVGGYFGKERLVHDHPVVEPAAGVTGLPATICAPHIGIAAGIQPKIGENAEGEVAVGYKINFEDGAHSSLFADGAVNYLLGGGFIGGGLTFWDIFEDDTRFVGLLLQGGFDLSDDGKWQLVGQARAPFNKFDDLDNNYQFWGGIRFRPNSWK
jgi:hypothetical protein